MFDTIRFTKAISLTAFAFIPVIASAQEPESDDQAIEEVVVVGTQIKGATTTDTLPVTVLNRDDLNAVGAFTTSELIATLPQAGGNNFSEESQGPNSARGDVAAANLRGLGSGNTLVLLNGRRTVLHPTTQTENQVPVQVSNINAIPGSAIERLEVLRDGAGAIYGADATAGVLNLVIDTDYEGASVSVRHGFSEGTSLDETSIDFKWGKTFNNGATNLAVFGTAFDRNGMRASDRVYASTDDLRLLAPAPFDTSLSLRNLSSDTPWIGWVSVDGAGDPLSITVGTRTDNDWHVQPGTFSGCHATLISDPSLCIDDNDFVETELRTGEDPIGIMTPDTERFNILTSLRHDLESDTTFFGEFSYYQAESFASRGGSGVLSSAPILIGSDTPFNPFGPVGAPNSINIVGDGIPDAGVDLLTSTFRIFDAGNRTISVDTEVYRILSGFEGTYGDWDWEFAGLYSKATVDDVEGNRTSATQLTNAINNGSYNPFTGGDFTNPQSPIDPTLNTTVGDSIRINATRSSESTLALFDFKLSTANLFALRGNDVGAAFGIERRREELLDNRDPRVDGTISYIHPVTGLPTSDVVNTSPSPDLTGARSVFSAYAELAVPLVTESDDIPLVQRIDAQLAVRYEDFSDIRKEIVKPKLALSWQVTDWLMVRGSYAEGFRAPNLEQVNAVSITRVNENVTDLGACLIQGIITDLSSASQAACTIQNDVEDIRSGSANLNPEDNESVSVGIALTPTPDLTITVDWWTLEQTDLVGIVSSTDVVDFDAIRILQGGTSGQVDRDAAGNVTLVTNPFLNLGAREITGVDVSVVYDIVGTRLGDFRAKLDWAYLDKFDQVPGVIGTELLAFGFSTSAGGSLLLQNDNPRERASASLSWRNGPWSASAFVRHIGDVEDGGVTVGGVNLPMDAVTTGNLSGAYTFEGGALDQTTIKVGINNITDEQPPLADDTFGFEDSIHSNRGRYFFLSISKEWF